MLTLPIPAALISPAIAGFALGAGLIVAIGAQNALVLRHGLRRDRVPLVVALCTACDWLLIGAGAAGFGGLVAGAPLLARAAAWLGAAFLVAYGALAFRSALRPAALSEDDAPAEAAGLAGVVTAVLAVSLLNPHALLDTVVLIGGLAAQYPGAERASFAVGAAAASTVWFAALGFGARLLAPLFARPAAWRVLDALIGVVMWSIALSLVLGG